MPILNQRVTVDMQGDFVVFLLGMRINKFWKFHKWMPLTGYMPKMIKELEANPDSGFLGYEMAGMIPPVIIQYWRSFEHLEAYAKDRTGQHYPAWKDFNTRIRKGGEVGIWHETYKVRAGEYECIYNNMPKYGLGKVGTIIDAVGNKEYARGRMSQEK